MDKEVLQCQLDGSACVITNLNAWLGKSILKDDPHTQNKNGQLFNEFLNRNPQLHLMNASEICEGAITRVRKANDRSERSILDFIIVCSQLLPYVKKIVIDEDKAYSLTNYSKRRIVNSDHNSLIMNLNLQASKQRKERKIIFNFRDGVAMRKFTKKTTYSDFSNILKGANNLEIKAKKWAKKLKDTIYECFKKVRIGKKSYRKCTVFRRKKSSIKNKIKSNIQPAKHMEN